MTDSTLNAMVRLGGQYAAAGMFPGLNDGQDDECPVCGGPLASDGVCADDTCGADEEVCVGYPEHDTRDTYRSADGTQWECRRTGRRGRVVDS